MAGKCPMDRRPPLAVSPRRLRPRRAPPSSDAPSVQTPAATSTRSKLSMRASVVAAEASPVWLEYQWITSELLAMAKPMKGEFGSKEDLSTTLAFPSAAGNTSPLFERGRFYEVYSSRRNERLKRKAIGFEEDEERVAEDPGVAVELAKRRSSKKAEGIRKSVPVDFTINRSSLRSSSVRTSKEMKKPSAASSSQNSSVAGRRISSPSSVRRLM